MALNPQKIFSIVMRVVKEISRARTTGQQPRPTSKPTRRAGAAAQRTGAGYPGDYRGAINYEYRPSLDGDADPGEIVWGWVPYEEDHSQGKDRPVLIVGRDQRWLLGVMLTSKDKNNSCHRNADYLDIGTGDWDRQRRPSEVKLDRIIRIAPGSVRREGAILDQDRFSAVIDALSRRN